MRRAKHGVKCKAWFCSYSLPDCCNDDVLTSVQQFWPMVAMAATQKGIMLPMILPNLDKYISKLPPAVCYTIQTPHGLESRYTGPGPPVAARIFAARRPDAR